MRKIYLLTDYKGHFGSKYNDVPYRSGMDRGLLSGFFLEKGFETVFLPFKDVDLNQNKYSNELILYTSSEDHQYLYKSYIEDVVFALELAGAKVIPSFKYLRANNNKVFMELLRDLSKLEEIKSIHSRNFGTYEELEDLISAGELRYPVVIKTAEGAMSSGVALAENESILRKTALALTRTANLKHDIWELGRQYKHKGYVIESKNRKKFIIQNMIEGLENDYKILVFGDKFYVIKRLNRKNDFRASGGGRLSYEKNISNEMLDFASRITDTLDLPHVSLDVAFDGTNMHLIEFQAVYFGSYTLTYSDFYFSKSKDGWKLNMEKSILEKEYVESIANYIQKKQL